MQQPTSTAGVYTIPESHCEKRYTEKQAGNCPEFMNINVCGTEMIHRDTVGQCPCVSWIEPKHI